jgi:anti-sigma B factor antagonist
MNDELAGVDLERHDRTAVAILSGEIDMSNATAVRQRIAGFVTGDDDAVVIDLSGLGFIDSAGLHALVELGAVLAERRQRLLLCAVPGSHVERALEIVGMRHTVPVLPGRAAAIEEARASAAEVRPAPPPTTV